MFREKLSGRNAERPELWNCLELLGPGDTLVVSELSRLGRSLHDLLALVAGLRNRGIGFTSLHEDLDTTTPGGRLVFHVFTALAEFIRELIVEGTREGLAAARANGVRLGRPPAMTPEQVRHARDLLTNPANTIGSIAELLGVSRSTIYKYVPNLAEIRAQLSAARVPVALPAGEPVIVALPDTATVTIRAMVCPTCGTAAASAHERFHLRRDLAELWLYADPGQPHGLRVRRHCQRCQPHEHLAVLECARCGQGPILVGEWADQAQDATLPTLVARRLELAGWRTAPALLCPDHASSATPAMGTEIGTAR